MRLEFIDSDHQNRSTTNRMNGDGSYWHASTDDGGWDGSGHDPLTAVSNLVAQMERELRDRS